MFIKVTSREGKELLVNADLIRLIEPQLNGHGCCLIFKDDAFMRTSTSFSDIENALSKVGGLVLYTNVDEYSEKQ